jgi:hypothetical protein
LVGWGDFVLAVSGVGAFVWGDGVVGVGSASAEVQVLDFLSVFGAMLVIEVEEDSLIDFEVRIY